MGPLKVISLILGIVLTLVGVAAMVCGGVVLGLNHSYSDDDGFFMTSSETIGSNGFALTVPDLSGQLTSEWQRWALSHSQATLRVTGSSQLPAPLFIGVAPTGQATQYLSGVARDRITSVDLDAGSVEYEHVDGTAVPGSPREQGFWVARAAGAGSQTLEWTLEQGDWAVVIMNADGSAPVVADLRIGARFGILSRLVVGLFSGGAAFVALGALLLFFGSRRRRRTAPPVTTFTGPR